MAKFQFITVDLYNHFFSEPKVVEAPTVVDAVVLHYADPDIREEVQAQFDKNDHQRDGLATNKFDGSWRISGEEDLVLITQLPE